MEHEDTSPRELTSDELDLVAGGDSFNISFSFNNTLPNEGTQIGTVTSDNVTFGPFSF